jgi:hypothetical protein
MTHDAGLAVYLPNLRHQRLYPGSVSRRTERTRRKLRSVDDTKYGCHPGRHQVPGAGPADPPTGRRSVERNLPLGKIALPLESMPP